MKEFTEGAFAKVNLTLDVLDKREDGYHNLRSIMQTVSLHDDVHVTVGCEGWQVHCYREILSPDAAETTEPELVTCGLPQDRDNLVWKAAEAFYARTGKTPEGLEIFINKRIPLEAGLGGGSADAFGRSGDDGCFPLQFHGSLTVCCCIRKVFSLYAFGYP